MQKGSAWIDGRLSVLSEAVVPVSDRGLLFGHAIFETILAFGESLVLWDAHVARLQAGAIRSRLKCPPEADLRRAVRECIRFFQAHPNSGQNERVSVRLILTGGDCLSLAPQRNHRGELLDARVIVICRSAPALSDAERMKGLALKACPDIRPKELVDIKSCSYLWNLMCLDDALLDGFDDALFLNANGDISESASASFVWMGRAEKILYSAPQDNNVLAGTTLSCLISALQDTEYKFDWQALNMSFLKEVYACALVSSVRGLVPVRRINDFEFDVNVAQEEFSRWDLKLRQQQLSHSVPPPR
jgi:4-amino-4-deoxychorismate lyase